MKDFPTYHNGTACSYNLTTPFCIRETLCIWAEKTNGCHNLDQGTMHQENVQKNFGNSDFENETFGNFNFENHDFR